MINIHVPQALYRPGSHERLMTADVIRSGQYVYLFNLDYPEVYDTSNLEIRHQGKTLQKVSDNFKNHLAQKFLAPDDMPDEQHLEIWDGDIFVGAGKSRRIPLKTKVKLSAATLFKNDYPQLKCWIDYHIKLGFERFILYYNGPISDIIPEIIDSRLAEKADVLLVPWPYTYWVDGTDMGPEGLIAKFGDYAPLKAGQKDWHHAQQLMLNHALITLQDTTEFLGFFDLDEYFRPNNPNQSVLSFCQNHQQDIYIFLSRWSELHDNATPKLGDDSNFLREHKILAAPEWVPFPARTKYIGRPEKILQTGAHTPKSVANGTKMVKVDCEAIGIYHFHSFSGKASRRNIVTPGGEWIEIENFSTPS